jgi:hypothetical protein
MSIEIESYDKAEVTPDGKLNVEGMRLTPGIHAADQNADGSGPIRIRHMLCDAERPVRGKDGKDYFFTCQSKADNETTHACTGSEHKVPGTEVICVCGCHQSVQRGVPGVPVAGVPLSRTAESEVRVRITVELLDYPDSDVDTIRAMGRGSSYSFILDEAVISNNRGVTRFAKPDGRTELVPSPDVTWSITGTEHGVGSH